MALTVVLALWVGLAGLLGLLRRVRAGLVALAGTLLAAALLELWAAPIAAWVRATFRPELPAAPTFAATAAAFLLAAGLLGYGGSALLPRAGAAAAASPVAERALGAMLGALNGAVVAAYLLRYALAIWGGREAAAAAVAASPVAGVLVAWLPWYALAVAAALGGLVLWRIGRGLAARPARRAAGGSVAAAPTLSEADRRLSDRIDEALKK